MKNINTESTKIDQASKVAIAKAGAKIYSITHTQKEQGAWWQVDLGSKKNITYPTDAKLAIKIINRLNKLAKRHGILH
jgi:hypothetical protein